MAIDKDFDAAAAAAMAAGNLQDLKANNPNTVYAAPHPTFTERLERAEKLLNDFLAKTDVSQPPPGYVVSIRNAGTEVGGGTPPSAVLDLLLDEDAPDESRPTRAFFNAAVLAAYRLGMDFQPRSISQPTPSEPRVWTQEDRVLAQYEVYKTIAGKSQAEVLEIFIELQCELTELKKRGE